MINKIFKIILIISFIINLDSISYSQNVNVNASIDTNNVLIGDQIHLKLLAKSDKKTNIILPQLPDSIGKLEIISRSKIDTISNDKGFTLKQIITLTSFDSGRYELPALTFSYEKTGISNLIPIGTNPLILNFTTVPVDTAKPIKDIKPVFEVPITWEEIMPYVGIGLGILLVIAAIIYFFMKKKPKEIPKLSYDPKIPAHVAALQALKELDNEKLWQSGKIKQYHSRITDILRLYLERRFSIPALESITSEIIESLNDIKISKNLIDKINQVLILADLAKFAKTEPTPEENSLSMTICIEIVQSTIPMETIATNNVKEK